MFKDDQKPFYQQNSKEIELLLQTNIANGLSDIDAKKRLEKLGLNQLKATKKIGLVQKFINQFKDFMIVVLLIAAFIAGMTGEIADAIIILAVVVLNAVFGVYQESKADAAIESLQKMSAPNANVRRDGNIMTLHASELVPGDIVSLEAGDVVPADMRLVESASLKIEESSLTGESIPVEKQAEVLDGQELSLGDRTNLAFMNSNVTYGHGIGVVIGTGMNTEVGNIAEMLETTDVVKTPLQVDLSKLGKSLTYLIFIIAVIVFIVGMFKTPENGSGNRIVDMLLTSISLAVAAIPEGLPAIVTITLALGTNQLVKRHALMRKLPAVETLGSTEIIGSDKTGTLTQNKMTVEKYYVDNDLIDAQIPVRGSAVKLIDLLALNNDTKINTDGDKLGDPTETALITFNETQHRDLVTLFKQYPRIAEIPFDSERKLMTTIHNYGNKFIITVKGAPDELLKRTTQRLENNKPVVMKNVDKNNILSVNMTMAKDALRVLGFAYKIVDEIPIKLEEKLVENDLIFVGLIGMIDPERPEVADAVAEAKNAGIRTLMITGDHKITAEAISRRLGILSAEQGSDSVITGYELDQLDDKAFKDKVTQYSVYARVAPEHKVRIVQAWQSKGRVVAMTGDGVNDAPALKIADIGIAMGITGTEVSKSAADMVLADDNFSTIVNAVKEGRKVFSNIQKSIQYLLSANLGEVLTIFIMTIMGWNIFAPVHVLWINLVTDTLPAISLGMESVEPGIMKLKPRGRNSDFLSNGLGSTIIYQGLIEGFITLGVYLYAINYPAHTSFEAIHADALTMAFATLGLIQLFHAFNTKSIYQSIFKVGFFKNKSFNWAIIIAIISLAITIIIPGLNNIFHVTHLDCYQWILVIAASFSIIPIVEIIKFVQRCLMYKK